ncbi:hypothetical protein C8K18_12369 [Paraburkholderia sp. GV068]|jgi:hypothetical protein|nr:hypothetical protein C8K19_12369 [Paraburkholderia sp. GV072]PUA94327.1 hypothetical protein C8K18_12369 [Paraburkholderia sp. GV068]
MQMMNLTRTASLTVGAEVPDGTTRFRGLGLIEVAPDIDIQRDIGKRLTTAGLHFAGA